MQFINGHEEEREEIPEEEAPPEEDPVFAAEEEPLIGLVGDITESATQQVAMMLLQFNGGAILRDPPEEREADIEFFISSAGGSMSEMFAIYDLMNLVKENRDIATFGYGKIASAAVPILAGGTKGKRHLAKHARVMLHHCSSNVSGPHPSVRANYNELKKVEDMMVQLLAENSHMSAGEIYNIFSKNTDEYFSAQDALEMGIVDKII
jgi:ATP-dependent Clp endopeptidase proteolytic subunit ClpP